MTKTKPKVMMITGGASGIGASMARQAAAAGHQVIIADIDAARARQVAAAIGNGAQAVALDICSSEQWEAVLDDVWRQHGRLDVLVNNAAIVRTGYARDVSIAAHQQVMDTNFMGPLRGMLAGLSRFKAQGHGHLVTICSMTGFLPFPGLASYAAAKHALRAFHHALALEERASPVKFTIIHPTSTETPMLEKEAEDDALALAFAGPSMSADMAAATILAAVEKNAIEVFMPPERGKIVRRVGTSPRSLRKLIERNEVIGAERLAQRRASAAAKG
ncbi:MAG: SDR family oxidoreductase [Mesorhizobium sp.]|nr:SDR family oxidoreductase [Mesorhizobium sp.]MCO5161799.1 SDR family oxidoreductase [Mesorhizobium sp.]